MDQSAPSAPISAAPAAKPRGPDGRWLPLDRNRRQRRPRRLDGRSREAQIAKAARRRVAEYEVQLCQALGGATRMAPGQVLAVSLICADLLPLCMLDDRLEHGEPLTASELLCRTKLRKSIGLALAKLGIEHAAPRRKRGSAATALAAAMRGDLA